MVASSLWFLDEFVNQSGPYQTAWLDTVEGTRVSRAQLVEAEEVERDVEGGHFVERSSNPLL